jgi:CheY-like chemotaxis protein/HPt (histidine-containing phosphotransfer) domain-containing protein
MPEQDGLSLVRHLRTQERFAHLPLVLMVSALTGEETLHTAETTGVTALLHKPINRTLVHECLARLLAPTNAPPAPPPFSSALPSSLPPTGQRILLAEDNDINQQVAREMLEGLGMQVDVADNGRRAVEMVIEKSTDPTQRYKLVLMDVQMPEMDGLQATVELRRRLPLSPRLPIIAMTAHALETERQRCLEVGMDDHLPKPVDPDCLATLLHRWLSSSPSTLQPFSASPVVLLPSESAVESAVSPPMIDTAAALRRLNGNRHLLDRLLADFRDKYQTVSETLTHHLEHGEQTEARRLVHTLKGVAGNLSALPLFEAAQELEHHLLPPSDSSLISPTSPPPEVLARFHNLLRETISSIPAPVPSSSAIGTHPPHSTSSEPSDSKTPLSSATPATATLATGPSATVTPATIASALASLNELLDLVRHRRLSARRKAEQLAENLPEPFRLPFTSILQQVGQLNFSAAESGLKYIIENPPNNKE